MFFYLDFGRAATRQPPFSAPLHSIHFGGSWYALCSKQTCRILASLCTDILYYIARQLQPGICFHTNKLPEEKFLLTFLLVLFFRQAGLVTSHTW